MADNVQTWSIGDGVMYLADEKSIVSWHELNDAQEARVHEAWALWDDVSGFTAVWDYTDDDNLANDLTTKVTEPEFLWWGGDTHWKAELPNNWTRVAMGTIRDPNTLGVNTVLQLNGETSHYREIYIDGTKVEGADTFRLGSQAFHTLVHEIGHSVLDNLPDQPSGVGRHIVGDSTHSMMNPQSITPNNGQGALADQWYAATPMSYDIDQAIARYGVATTRTGDDTYGFNAHFSGGYRAALDFNVNTRPLITIYDSAGNDTLDASGFTGSFLGFSYARPVHVDLNPGATSYMLDGYRQPFAVIYQGERQTTWIENAVGGGGDDELYGNALANILSGNGGNDILDGRGGADIMMGGGGNDTYYVNDAGDQALEWPWASEGDHDKVYTVLDYYDLNDFQRATGIEDLEFQDDLLDLLPGMWGREPTRHTGIGNDANNIITGSRGVDTLFGNGGNDTLNGGGGNDFMSGGTGNDTYIVDSYGDTVSEETFSPYGFSYDSGGVDEIRTNLSVYALPENFDSRIENLSYTGIETFVGIGNSLDNIIQGGNGGDETHGDVLIGGEGGDQLYGWDGADTLVGGAGADGMNGGRGSDTIIMDNGTALGGELADGGNDLDTVRADDSVAATGLNLVLVPTGTDFASVPRPAFTSVAQDIEHVIGGTGNDRVDAGRLGAGEFVRFEGNEGNDTFVVSAASDKFDGGAGIDTAFFAGAASDYVIGHEASINADVVMDRAGHAHILTGVEVLHFSDGDLATTDAIALRTPGRILTGTDASDVLTGGDGNDRIEGGGGMNWLTGGAGADQLIGGSGMDFIYVDSDDTLIDGGGGFDYVYLDSSRSYGADFRVAGTNVEYVGGTLADDRVDATGVTNRVVLFGNYGNDVLIGGSGNDGIDGSANNDTVTGGTGNDTFYFAAHWGNDTVTDFTHGEDVLELRWVNGLTSMSQLSITDTAQGASIAFGSESILLEGVAANTLTASDFHFLA